MHCLCMSLLSMKPWAMVKKSFELVWRYHHLLSRVLAKATSPECHISHVSANDKDDNEMILGAVHRSLGIYLTAVENPRKPWLRDHLMKAVWGPLPPNDIGRVTQHIREGETKKWIGKGCLWMSFLAQQDI